MIRAEWVKRSVSGDSCHERLASWQDLRYTDIPRWTILSQHLTRFASGRCEVEHGIELCWSVIWTVRLPVERSNITDQHTFLKTKNWRCCLHWQRRTLDFTLRDTWIKWTFQLFSKRWRERWTAFFLLNSWLVVHTVFFDYTFRSIDYLKWHFINKRYQRKPYWETQKPSPHILIRGSH